MSSRFLAAAAGSGRGMALPRNSSDDAGGFAGLDRRVWVVAGVIVLGTVMPILDTTIVNVALDTLARRFHTTLASIQWVSTGYLLALATFIPVTGWAVDRFGPKRVWLTSIVLSASPRRTA